MRLSPVPKQHGFSYVGLLILLAIVGTLSAATLTAGSAMQRRATEDELLFIGEQFQRALNSYANASPPGWAPHATRPNSPTCCATHATPASGATCASCMSTR